MRCFWDFLDFAVKNFSLVETEEGLTRVSIDLSGDEEQPIAKIKSRHNNIMGLNFF